MTRVVALVPDRDHVMIVRIFRTKLAILFFVFYFPSFFLFSSSSSSSFPVSIFTGVAADVTAYGPLCPASRHSTISWHQCPLGGCQLDIKYLQDWPRYLLFI